MEVSFEEVLGEKRKIVWEEIQKYLNSLDQFPDVCKIPRKYSSLAEFHQDEECRFPALFI